jgi:ribosome maturation factor RimP
MSGLERITAWDGRRGMEDTLESDIRPIVESMGLTLVEVAVGRAHRQTHLRIVVHRSAGVTVDECGKLARILQPRLETREGLEDLTMEISSPGIDRKLKSNEELAIFADRGVRVLVGDQWLAGINRGVTGEVMTLEQENEVRKIELSSIRRARLDHTLEAVR